MLGAELFDVSFHDLVDQFGLFAFVECFVAGDFFFTLDDGGVDAFGADGQGVGGRNLQSQLFGQALEFVGAGHEVALAVEFQHHAEPAVEMYIGKDDSFFGRAQGLAFGLGNSAFAQILDGGFHVAIGFHQRFAALHHACCRSLAQFFYHACANLCHFYLLVVSELLVGEGLSAPSPQDLIIVLRWALPLLVPPRERRRVRLLPPRVQRLPRSLPFRYRRLRWRGSCLRLRRWP